MSIRSFEAPPFTGLPSAKLFLPPLQPSKPTFLNESSVPEVKVEEAGVEECSINRSRSSCATSPVASVPQMILTTDCLCIVCEFVEYSGLHKV